jgi:malic enzyme
VCAFPYIFRGALDCRARCVNEEMKLAATHAIARMAKQLQPVKVSLSRSSSWASLMDMEHREQNGVSSKSSSRLGSARSKSPGRKSPRSRSRDLRNRPLRPSSTNDLGGGEDGEEGQACVFGRDYIIPKPFDERLLVEVSSAVAAAAIDSGVAGITLDMVEYRDHLSDMMAIKAGHDRSQDKAS